LSQTQSLIFDTTDAGPSRMGGATGAAERTSTRPSLLDRLIEERRRGDCAEPRRARPAAEPARAAEPEVVAPAPAPITEGERSLDDLVSATWESLGTAEVASCFVCGGDLLPRFGAGARPVGGRCTDCGSELS
jgi:hypothetical protein